MKNVIVGYVFFLALICSYQLQAQSPNVQLADSYYNKGDYEKAISIYERILKKDDQYKEVYENYRKSLLALREYDDLQKLVKKGVKNYPEDVKYEIDFYLIDEEKGKPEEAYKQLQTILKSSRKNPLAVNIAATHLLNRNKLDLAIEFYETSRKALNEPYLFSEKLADLYFEKDDKSKMIDEYIKIIGQNNDRIEEVQNRLQLTLELKEVDLLIDKLLKKIYEVKNEQIYNYLLVWAYIQQQDFYNAFVQERAIDKQENLSGERLAELASISVKSNDYETALSIYEYICKAYPNHPNFFSYKRDYVNTQEKIYLSRYPIDSTKIRELISDYEILKSKTYNYTEKANISRSQARLYAFYLNDVDKAVSILEQTAAMPRVSSSVLSNCKLDLADIYLLKDDPRASLLYFQVEKEQNDNQISHLAKLKNAKYWYYNGDFELAKSQLDVLKLATSREIANDAIDLSVFIQDNLGLDTTEEALKLYAKSELYFFQHQYDQSQQTIAALKEKFPKHTLLDEAAWVESNIELIKGNYEKAIVQLDVIINLYGSDILADDALFQKAHILENNLKRKKEAMELYKEILINKRNSIFVAEARKRYRKLRGDQVN